MKILYAVQATGNGHISRAMQLLPFLEQYGKVDIFLSGSNSSLALNAPVAYRSKGVSLFYNSNGGLHYTRIAQGCNPLRIWRDIQQLPVTQYDLVLNDFDFITSMACKLRKVPSIQFGHQASFQSVDCPKPLQEDKAGAWILKNFATSRFNLGYHFSSYDDFIFTPVIKKDILEAMPVNKQHIAVYLPAYSNQKLYTMFNPIHHTRFEIFSKQVLQETEEGNITWKPITPDGFSDSMIASEGVITGGGFETPAEALHLGKKIMSIPIKNHYEQQCNAAALELMGVTVVEDTLTDFQKKVEDWLQYGLVIKRDYSRSIQQSLHYLFEKVQPRLYESLEEEKENRWLPGEIFLPQG
jgi:uncharacterized protein (TIGR00661 family)